jgi:hypothetical protein
MVYDLSTFRWAAYRGSGLLEVWIAALGARRGLAGLLFASLSRVSHVSHLARN